MKTSRQLKNKTKLWPTANLLFFVGCGRSFLFHLSQSVDLEGTVTPSSLCYDPAYSCTCKCKCMRSQFRILLLGVHEIILDLRLTTQPVHYFFLKKLAYGILEFDLIWIHQLSRSKSGRNLICNLQFIALRFLTYLHVKRERNFQKCEFQWGSTAIYLGSRSNKVDQIAIV